MAKLLFYFAFCACLVASSKQQQSRERQLEAFRLAQSVDKQVQIARDLSGKLESLLNVARSELNNIGVSKGLSESALNATLQPYASVILDALQTANSANSSAKDCVAKARASIAHLITSAVNKEVLDCQTKTRTKLSNFVLKLTSLYNAQGSTFSNAVSDCPYSFFIESASDLEEARVCYTAANNTIKAYIIQTTKDLEESQATLNALQGNSCLSLGVEVAVKQGQAAVASMVACGKAAGISLPNLNTINDAIEAGAAEIKNFYSIAKSTMTNIKSTVNGYLAELTSRDPRVKSEIDNAMATTKSFITMIERFLAGSESQAELACLNAVLKDFDRVVSSVTFTTKFCFASAQQSLDLSTLTQSESKLQSLLSNASEEAVARCSSAVDVTETSVKRCMAEELAKIQAGVQTVFDDLKPIEISARNLVVIGEKCLSEGRIKAPRDGDAVLDICAACLAQEGIVFKFDRAP